MPLIRETDRRRAVAIIMSEQELKIPLGTFDVSDGNGSTLNKILKKNSIDDLVVLEENLIHDIKVLDCEMKNLVYENYNKLLQTSDIIKAMGVEFEEIHTSLHSLESLLKDSFANSIKLSHSLAPVQKNFVKDKQNKLANTMLSKIFNLPETLKKHIQTSNFDQFTR